MIPEQVVEVRRSICRRCDAPCELFQLGDIKHSDPLAACPRVWRGQWGAYGRPQQTASAVPASQAETASQIPVPVNLWAVLHRRALHWAGGDDSAWLADFSRFAPCGACRGHWAAYLAAHPPVWSDYFAWTVSAHNAVNQRLGKPEIDVETALELYLGTPQK